MRKSWRFCLMLSGLIRRRGCAAVRALGHYLRSHLEAVPDQEDVLADMTGIEEECADAERAGVRFRFAIVP